MSSVLQNKVLCSVKVTAYRCIVGDTDSIYRSYLGDSIFEIYFEITNNFVGCMILFMLYSLLYFFYDMLLIKCLLKGVFHEEIFSIFASI